VFFLILPIEVLDLVDPMKALLPTVPDL